MTEWDFLGALDVIKNGINPEIWHVRNSSHPGIGWSIKTVIPKPQFAGIESRQVIEGWVTVCAEHPTFVTWTDDAYDWEGNLLKEWQTMWVRDGYDVDQQEHNDSVVYKLVTAVKGREPALELVIDRIRSQLAQSNDEANTAELTELLEIAEAMLTQTSDSDSRMRRKKLKVVDDD